jgi:hypothetical protein
MAIYTDTLGNRRELIQILSVCGGIVSSVLLLALTIYLTGPHGKEYTSSPSSKPSST